MTSPFSATASERYSIGMIQTRATKYITRATRGMETRRFLDAGSGGRATVGGLEFVVSLDLHKANNRLDVVGGLEALPFRDGCFDVVLASCLFCSVTKIEDCLTEIARVLVPGGFLIGFDHVHNPNRILRLGQERTITRRLSRGLCASFAPELLLEDQHFEVHALEAPGPMFPAMGYTLRRIM